MKTINVVCPICEEINSKTQVVCRCCGQDMRVVPLGDYLSFLDNPPESQRNELCFQFGTLKHKLKISFDSIKYLLMKKSIDKTNTVFNYYHSLLERERSSLSYYLLLFSRRVYMSYHDLLMLDFHVYFTLISSLLTKAREMGTCESSELFSEGVKLVTEQKNKIQDAIESIIDELEKMEDDEFEEEIWDSPPPPPTSVTFPGILEN